MNFVQSIITVLAGLLPLTAAANVEQPNIRSNGDDIGLTIVGTITHSRVADNVALVKEFKSGRIKAVKAGFKILESSVVKEVQAKYMVIVHNKQDHLVYQNKFAGEFSKSTINSLLSSGPDLLFREEGFERTQDQINMTASYRDRIVNEQLSTILMQATAVPVESNGQILGFRLFQIDKGSIFDKAGFVDHDIVTSINGHKLNSAGGAIKLLQSLKGTDAIELEYMRGGETKKVAISVQ